MRLDCDYRAENCRYLTRPIYHCMCNTAILKECSHCYMRYDTLHTVSSIILLNRCLWRSLIFVCLQCCNSVLVCVCCVYFPLTVLQLHTINNLPLFGVEWLNRNRQLNVCAASKRTSGLHPNSPKINFLYFSLTMKLNIMLQAFPTLEEMREDI